ncbi:hypothetical protein [Absidia glauca]|uniref:Reverse transcriptase domain-containing protein n=1 Tax=Absidia glauca TaxID=4829 RepID=A0A168L3R6_ABSGL|nr:hypothetical protein [Absidia glauca]
MATHLQGIFSGALLQSRSPPPPSPSIRTSTPSPFTTDLISTNLRQLAPKKAPGSDSITAEMLFPILDPLAPLLLLLFDLCWTSDLIPTLWRTSQVIPIHKKGDTTLASNYRPISLTSVFQKILEKCLQPTLPLQSPPLDIAQGGFQPQRSTLDQVLCLTELCRIHHHRHRQHPTLAFLDIKSAYDTVDRMIIWDALRPTATPSLLRLLQHLVDEVATEVLLNNHQSAQFHPATGVLQGSILSPFLYSLQQLGYRWSPTKSIILPPPPRRRSLDSPSSPYHTIYHTSIPTAPHFNYLGIPIRPGGSIDTNQLIQHNSARARPSMDLLTTIGVRATGYSRLLSTRFYKQFVRPQMEYGLAITKLTKTSTATLDRTQDHCLRRIFGASPRSTTIIMRHISNTPPMSVRHSTLQLKYLARTTHQPSDTLLSNLSPPLAHQP